MESETANRWLNTYFHYILDLIKMSESYGIAVDLGATYVRAVLSDANGRFLVKVEERTSKKNAGSISEQLIKMSRLLCRKAGMDKTDIEGACIASAGPLDLRKGEIVNGPNFLFEHIPLVKPVQDELGKPVYLLNDCIAGVIGEHEFGAGKGVNDLVYITISTGIGGGAYVNGHLLFGKDGNAVEVGHTTIDLDGMKCGCGKIGHWEAYCSGRNIPNFVRMKLKTMDKKRTEKSLLYELTNGTLSNLSAEILFKAAKSKDRLSLELVDEIGKLNAVGFANVIGMYDPSLITVGGSVALKNEKLIMGPLKRHLKDHVFNRPAKIMITPLGNDVGLYGAATTVFNPPEELKRGSGLLV
jgi:glucokinase